MVAVFHTRRRLIGGRGYQNYDIRCQSPGPSGQTRIDLYTRTLVAGSDLDCCIVAALSRKAGCIELDGLRGRGLRTALLRPAGTEKLIQEPRAQSVHYSWLYVVIQNVVAAVHRSRGAA